MEFKFRAWHPDYPEIIYSSNEPLCDKREFYPFNFSVGFSHYPEKGWVIMQSTGFKDDSGKESYEGDITDDGRIIIWHKGAFWLKQINGDGNFPLHFLISGKLDRMIIGNKYENPELITQTN